MSQQSVASAHAFMHAGSRLSSWLEGWLLFLLVFFWNYSQLQLSAPASPAFAWFLALSMGSGHAAHQPRSAGAYSSSSVYAFPLRTQIVLRWRQKEKLKTTAVALVLCLNIGVDPPDVIKISPCARLECWVDPMSNQPAKALETIGANDNSFSQSCSY